MRAQGCIIVIVILNDDTGKVLAGTIEWQYKCS